jgi:uncharacterized membrane protein YkvA (DUF1232 family)
MENDTKSIPCYTNDGISGRTQPPYRHAARFSDGAFFDKLGGYGRQAGAAVVYAGMLLYYLLKKDGLPLQVKLAIAGALGYFILPVDALPDFIVGLGYTDDLSVLIGVLTCCYVHIDDGVRDRARAKVKEWFGEDCRGIGIVDGMLRSRQATGRTA